MILLYGEEGRETQNFSNSTKDFLMAINMYKIYTAPNM
jgi:hypothetical protein